MKMYTLIGTDGKPYQSEQKGTFGGYRPGRIYGRFDCPSANNAIAKGQYVQHRVFFADELTAITAGYRPCARCMKDRYPLWKQAEGQAAGDRKRALEIYRSLCGY
ncbi:Ada metal-binding domain-containing protein [Dictyobacter formicarum]|uniref:Metal-binding protein n=1 Tax=Dictyobacter formicarum TaxID=2778368 RepID=A0ABQ3VFV8_9CHLR|nr:Ada metal-binding domain-containing protein [Dictyobacter formicarum]GHO84356.1 metal-binding protein [Dictyobacter formicarum]